MHAKDELSEGKNGRLALCGLEEEVTVSKVQDMHQHLFSK